jgi:hypothetical protein
LLQEVLLFVLLLSSFTSSYLSKDKFFSTHVNKARAKAFLLCYSSLCWALLFIVAYLSNQLIVYNRLLIVCGFLDVTTSILLSKLILLSLWLHLIYFFLISVDLTYLITSVLHKVIVSLIMYTISCRPLVIIYLSLNKL